MIKKFTKFSERLNQQFTSVNLLLFQLVLTLIAFIQTWVMQYQDRSGSANLIGRVSWQVYDPPFMPSGRNPLPILYEHVFGDWYMGMDYVNLPNPYTITNSPSQTPPVGNLFLYLLSPLGQRYGFAVFLCLVTIIWLWIFKKVFSSEPLLFVFLSAALYFFLTLPTVVSFDRGSLHILAFGLLGTAWIKYTENKFSISAILFILAVSMKPQLSLVLVLLLVNKDFIRFIKIILWTLATNLILLLFYEGEFLKTLTGYLKATAFFASSKAGGYMLDSASMTGFVLRRIENRKGQAYVIDWINSNDQVLSIIGITTILFILPVLFSSRISHRVKFFFVLSLTSLAAPVSMAYTMVWGSLAIIPFLTRAFDIPTKFNVAKKITGERANSCESELESSRQWSISDYTSFLCVALILTPSFMLHWTGVRNISFSRDRYPYLVFLTLFISYMEIFLGSKLISFRKLIEMKR